MPVFSFDFYTIFSILYHFDTVLGGFMGSGGGGRLPACPWNFVEEFFFVKPGGSRIKG